MKLIQNTPGTPDPSNIGFTRADLVASLAVLTLAACLLWPALGRETDTSQRTVCVANLRLIMAAVAMYTTENNEAMPYPTWGSISGSPGPHGWAYATRITNTQIPNVANLPAPFGHTRQLPFYAAGQLAPFLPGQPTLMCPTDWASAQYEQPYSYLYRQREMKLTSYTMNAAVSGYGAAKEVPNASQGATYKATAFSPQDILFWEVDELVSFNFNDAASNPANSLEGGSQRHSRLTTGVISDKAGPFFIARLGGQVDAIAYTNFTKLQSSNIRPNNLLCGPGYQ